MDFSKFETKTLEALHRCCKTKGYAFFKDPHLTIALRQELEKRQQTKGRGIVLRFRPKAA